MAREDFESLVEAVKHVESRGQRYAANARQLLTSHKGAEGEMQVLPKTQKSPGYGIEPAKAGDPEDIARVGREYLRAMLDKYGNREHALAAYNWGPGNVDKWLAKGADPSKLPKETQNYLIKVNKRLGTQTADVSRETSPPAPTEAEKVVEPALRSGMSAQAPASPPVQASEQLAAMGPSYQAALALAVLSDVDEEERKDRDIDDDREPSISQKWLMEQGSRPTALASLSDISIKSPFPEQTPVRMADGGDVSRPATFNPMIRRQGEAARRLAALRDVNTLPDPKTYAAVSSFLGTPPDELGFSVLHPKYQEIQRVAEPAFIAGTALGLAPAAKPVVQAGKAVAKAAAPKVGQAMEDYMFRQGMALPAAKPRGGTFLMGHVEKEGNLVPASDLQKLLDNYLNTAISKNAPDEVLQFLENKAPKYFTSVYGTADDPLRTAIREEKILPVGKRELEDVFPPYLLEAAKNPEARGHELAKRKIEEAYDRLANVNVSVLDIGKSPNALNVRETLQSKMAQEGVPQDYMNLPWPTIYKKQELKDYPLSARGMLNALQMQEEGRLPSNMQFALAKGEPVYDVSPSLTVLKPEEVVDALSQLPPNKLKNMSFADALVQGNVTLRPIRDYNEALDSARRGAKVPEQALKLFTEPKIETPSSSWVQITDPRATEMEGLLMKHSVGGYASGDSYGIQYTKLPYGGKQAFDEGLVQVYSLRNKSTMLPEVTVEVARANNGNSPFWDVTQIRGRFNSEPVGQQRQDVMKLLDYLEDSLGLMNIKSNSYAKDAAGESITPNSVNWAQEYMRHSASKD